MQLSSVPDSLRTILDAEVDVTGEVRVLENKTVDMFVYYKPCSMFGASAFLIN